MGCARSMHDKVALGGKFEKHELAVIQAASAEECAVVTDFVMTTPGDGEVYYGQHRGTRILWVSASARELHA